jgi:hypothetical protein
VPWGAGVGFLPAGASRSMLKRRRSFQSEISNIPNARAQRVYRRAEGVSSAAACVSGAKESPTPAQRPGWAWRL